MNERIPDDLVADDLVPDDLVPDELDLDVDEADSEELDDEDLPTEDDFAAEEIFDVWLELGWFSLLPTALFSVTEAAVGLTFSRDALAEAVETNLTENSYSALEGDPLWLIADRETAIELELAEPGNYDEYLEGERQQQANWQELVTRDPSLAVGGLQDLVDLLVRFELVSATEEDGVFELADEVPDPLDLLPLTEDEQREMLEKRPEEETDPVVAALHDFLFHSDDTQLITSIGRLSKQALQSTDQTKILLAALVFGTELGLTIERFKPMEIEEVLALADHQKFTLRVDRSAPGLAEHGH